MTVAEWCAVVGTFCAVVTLALIVQSKLLNRAINGAINNVTIGHRLDDGEARFVTLEANMTTVVETLEHNAGRLDEVAAISDRQAEWHDTHEHNDDARHEAVVEWSRQFKDFAPMRRPRLRQVR